MSELRTPRTLLESTVCAVTRSNRFTDPRDRDAFMKAYKRAREDALAGGGQLYVWLRAALYTDHSAVVAGLIEGVASVRANQARRTT